MSADQTADDQTADDFDDQPTEVLDPVEISAPLAEGTSPVTEEIDISAVTSREADEAVVAEPVAEEVVEEEPVDAEQIVEEQVVAGAEQPTEVIEFSDEDATDLNQNPPNAPTNVVPENVVAENNVGPENTAPTDVVAPRRKHTLAWILGALAALAVLYTAAQWLVADRVPRNTDVLGIQLGGLPRETALTTLNTGLAERAAEPITLKAGDYSTVLNPSEAGLSLDNAATLDKLTGFSMNPIRLWEHLVGHGSQNPIVHVAQEDLDAAGLLASNRLQIAPVDGSVSIVDGAVVATPARVGQAVLPATITSALPQRWLVEENPLEFTPEAIEPEIDQAETDAAAAEARQIISGPVTVHVGDQTVYLSGQDIADALTFTTQGDSLEPQLNGEVLAERIIAGTHDLVTTPTEAHFTFVDSRPQIVAGQDGTTVDPEAAASAVLTAALSTGDRTANVQLTSKSPEYSVADLEALGVNEIVAEFSTPLTNDAVRTGNLVRGAELVTGTLVRPGEVFSLTDVLSPIDASNGFANAGVIVQGIHTEGMGGGLSQMATTTFNAGYFAGFEDVEHRPHSVFITRYPPGREATLAVGSLDMRFRNNTPYGAVLQSWVAGGELHVAIWSTPYFRVETTASARSNVQPATTLTHSGAGCVPQATGQAGFTITNTRRVYRLDTGELVETTPFTWTYLPDNGISCAAPEPVWEPDDSWQPDDSWWYDEGTW